MFQGKNVIITGGSSGIGKALAGRMVKAGASLALIARDRKKLEAVRNELGRTAAAEQKVEVFSCDVADFEAVEKTLSAIVSKLGLPYMLVNSAGILREGYFEKLPLAVFREIIEINYFGTLHCIKAALPYFQKRGKGRIVNICSMAGLIGAFGYSAYCSSKFAITGLTETLRGELKPQHIRFHLVCPPEFGSPMVDELNKYRTPENRALVQTMPVLDVEEVADAVMAGVEKGKYLIIPGRTTRVLAALNRWLPGLSRAIVDRQIKKVYRDPGGS